MHDVCIFAHYDKDHLVDPYVLHYLVDLKKCGFSIVFVTASRISPASKASVLELCDDLIERANIGHDFGSWSTGLERYRGSIKGRLLLANDSVYGPLFPLKPQLRCLLSAKADFYGMVQSVDRTNHLQSWFLLFEPQVIRSQAFVDIFCRPPQPISRLDVIVELELKATEHLQAAGFTYHALHLAGHRALLANPTSYLWQELIELDGIPFLKIGIVRDDPVGTFKSKHWRRVIAQRDPAVLEMIDRHLARTRAVAAARPSLMILARRRLYRRLVQIDDRAARRGWLWLVRLNSAVFKLMCAVANSPLSEANSSRRLRCSPNRPPASRD